MDCEFGGLDPELHDITEVAVIVTDYRLVELSQKEWKIRARADRISKEAAAISGYTEGGIRTLLMSEYYGRENFGSIFGLGRALQVGGFAAGPLISGAVYDATRRYDTAFVAFLALVAFGGALVATARRPVGREVWTGPGLGN